MLAWVIFLGGDVAFRAGRIMNVGILIVKLPVRFQKVVAVMIYAALLIVMPMTVKQSALLCMSAGKRTLEGTPFFSYVWVTISILIGSSLMLITAARRLYDLTISSDTTIISEI